MLITNQIHGNLRNVCRTDQLQTIPETNGNANDNSSNPNSTEYTTRRTPAEYTNNRSSKPGQNIGPSKPIEDFMEVSKNDCEQTNENMTVEADLSDGVQSETSERTMVDSQEDSSKLSSQTYDQMGVSIGSVQSLNLGLLSGNYTSVSDCGPFTTTQTTSGHSKFTSTQANPNSFKMNVTTCSMPTVQSILRADPVSPPKMSLTRVCEINNEGNNEPDMTSDEIDEATNATQMFGDSCGSSSLVKMLGLRDRSNRKPLELKQRYRRQTLQDMTRPLKNWLLKHKNNPYPTKAEKIDLAVKSRMTLTQVSNWFANARRRLKNTVKEPDANWAKRVNLFNTYASGNMELLHMSSDEASAYESSEEDAVLKLQQQQQQNEQEKSTTQYNVTLTAVHERLIKTPSTTDEGLSNQTQITFTRTVETESQQSEKTPTLPPPPPPPNNVQEEDTKTPQFRNFYQDMCRQVEETVRAGLLGSSDTTQPQFQQPQEMDMSNTISKEFVSETELNSTQEGKIDNGQQTVVQVSGHMKSPPREDLQAPKFKHSILQRYLNDSYQHSCHIQPVPHADSYRQRHASGSLSSHDFEEASCSSRSSPTREFQMDDQLSDYEEICRQWPYIENRAEDDLYWKEISAALALTSLARSRRKSNTTR